MGKITKQSQIIGENIRVARKIRGLSQRALANMLGIAFQNLSVWENGKGCPSAKYLILLSESLSVNLEQLTSQNGIASAAKQAFSPDYEQGYQDIDADRLQANAEQMLRFMNEFSIVFKRELSTNSNMKQIVSSCEELLRLLKNRI